MNITLRTAYRFSHVAFMVLAFMAVTMAFPAYAQENANAGADFMPAKAQTQTSEDIVVTPGVATHPAIRLTPDKSEMISLDQNARSVVVGNEAHVSVLMDSPSRLILVPRVPGATFFTVIGENGKVIMQRHAIVAAPTEKYVRVRRSCINAAAGCEETSVYYCPGMCHDVQIQTGADGSRTATDLMSNTTRETYNASSNENGNENQGGSNLPSVRVE